mmetsp:Transcript_70633/g.184164  ORF Transcript_70633/g.184164 Transcript_70633/m.184164 type:complete len:327 (+) Transcript_70633:427-1407(+)
MSPSTALCLRAASSDLGVGSATSKDPAMARLIRRSIALCLELPSCCTTLPKWFTKFWSFSSARGGVEAACTTVSQTASRSCSSRTYLAPISQLSSQSTRRATRPLLLHKWGSTRSKQRLTSRRYLRIASNDSTTSAARQRTALRAMSGSLLVSTRLRTACALSRISPARSSRPLRRKLATALRRAMLPARRCWASRKSGLYRRIPMRPSADSCSMALISTFRARASMTMSSETYRSSKSAHAASSWFSAVVKSCLVGRARAVAAPDHLSRTSLTPAQACWRASAHAIASALSSNLSPLTQIATLWSALASNRSIRYLRAASGKSAR